MRQEARRPSSSSDGEPSERSSSLTLADLLFKFPTPRLRRQAESFRIKYEAKFGKTDLTRCYTSSWPVEKQDWLLKNHPERYWGGLPPFIQAFIKEKVRAMHRQGNLDDLDSVFLELYLSGKMEVDGEGPYA